MTETTFLAEGAIEVGEHKHAVWLGMTVNTDTILSTGIAAGILVALVALFPPYIMWAPNAIWKAFDLFVGAIQAFIFSILTILYFSQAMEIEDHHD